MSKLGDNYVPPAIVDPQNMPFSCQWILSVLNKAVSKTVKSLDSYEFSDAASTVYSWWQYQFCDVFIEAIKPYFAGNDHSFASEKSSAQHALWVCLETGLRLLHPFMPYVTEELWQRLPAAKGTTRKESIVISDYPSYIEVSCKRSQCKTFWFLNILLENSLAFFYRIVILTFIRIGGDFADFNYFKVYNLLSCFTEYDSQGWTNEKAEIEMDLVESTVKCLRSLRAEVLGKSKNER